MNYKSKLKYALTIFFLLIITNQTIIAQNKMFRGKGWVHSNKNPIKKAEVTIRDRGNHLLCRILTDKNGDFFFNFGDDLKGMLVTVIIEHPNGRKFPPFNRKLSKNLGTFPLSDKSYKADTEALNQKVKSQKLQLDNIRKGFLQCINSNEPCPEEANIRLDELDSLETDIIVYYNLTQKKYDSLTQVVKEKQTEFEESREQFENIKGIPTISDPEEEELHIQSYKAQEQLETVESNMRAYAKKIAKPYKRVMDRYIDETQKLKHDVENYMNVLTIRSKESHYIRKKAEMN